MNFIGSLFGTQAFLSFPNSLGEWIAFLFLSLGFFWLCAGFRKTLFAVNRKRIWLFFVLLFIQPVLSLCIGIKIPEILSGQAIMLLAAIPWMIAAILIGPIPSVVLAIINGIFNAFWISHDLFVIFTVAAAALLFSWAVKQTYQGRLFNLIRHPMIAWVFISIITVPVIFLTGMITGNAIISPGGSYFSVGVPAGIAVFLLGTFPPAITSEILFDSLKKETPTGKVSQNLGLQSTRSKYLLVAGAIAGIVFILAAFMIWSINSTSILGNSKLQMETSAGIISNDVPFMVQMGQSLLENNAAKDLFSGNADNRRAALQKMLGSAPYFQQIYFIDSHLQLIEGYPNSDPGNLTNEDLARLHYVENGQGPQAFIVQTNAANEQSLLSFLIPVRGDNNVLYGVVLGRTDLRTNPFSQGILSELNAARTYQEAAALTDEYQRVILSNGTSIDKDQIQRYGSDGFYADSRFGNFLLVSSMPGISWKAAFILPFSELNQRVFEASWPALLFLVITLLLGFLGCYGYLSKILREISKSADMIEMQIPEELERIKTQPAISEISQLRSKFFDNKLDSENQIEEKEQLLRISNSLPCFGNYNDAIQPILQLILNKGADSVRVLVTHSIAKNEPLTDSVLIKAGATADLFSYLDPQVSDLVQRQNRLILPFAYRSTQLNLPTGFLHPGALIAYSLVTNQQRLGFLWAAFDQPSNFSKSDLDYFEQIIAEIQKKIEILQQFRDIDDEYKSVKQAVDKIPSPVILLDKTGYLLLVNSAANNLSGLINDRIMEETESRIIYKPLTDLFYQKDYNNLSPTELVFPDKHSYMVNIYPIGGEPPSYWFVFLQDSSPEKERMQKQNDFIETVSHDMRSPLTLVKGYINMLEMVGPLNDQQKDFVQKITINVDSMNKLVNNILDIKRLESGVGLKKELTSAAELLDETLAELKPSALQKNIQINCEKETTKMISVDRFLLKQALYNLIENGIKYSAVGGKIEIKLIEADHKIEYLIQDHGVGIAPIDLPKIFDKEYRNNMKNQDQNRGAGLGLAIVQSIAERHSGKAWAESQLGKGSTFHLEIPVVESEQ